MSMEQIVEVIQEWVQTMAQALAELVEKLNGYFKQQEEAKAKVQYVSYNPSKENAWYNQYIKKTTLDRRTDIKPFLIHKY